MGLFELIIILVIALIVLGPEQMPELLRGAIKVFREVRAAAGDMMEEITDSLDISSSQPSDFQPPPEIRRDRAEQALPAPSPSEPAAEQPSPAAEQQSSPAAEEPSPTPNAQASPPSEKS